MENPVKALTSNLTLPKILTAAVLMIVVAFIADAAGVTDWLLFPYRTAKAKFFPKAA